MAMVRPVQRQPLLISSILRHAARHHPHTGVLSCSGPGLVERTTYAALELRARRLLRVLRRLGVLPGDRVATLALSGIRHLELACATTGLGAMFHPLDPGLPDDELTQLLDRGDDCVLFVDPGFADLAAAVLPRVRHCVRRLVVLCDEAALPMVYLPVPVSLHCYEPLLAAEDPDEAWPVFSEDVAAVLSAAGGAGETLPVVAHSQRDIVLRTMAANQPDGLGLRATDHVLAGAELHQHFGWDVPLAAAMSGSTLLLPGWAAGGAGLAEFVAAERATCVAASADVLLGVARQVAARNAGGWPAMLPALQRVVLGGGAPAALLADLAAGGIAACQSYGVAEAGGMLTSTAPVAALAGLGGAALMARAGSQGRALFGTDLRLADSDGSDLPWDGLAEGELQVRGPATGQILGEPSATGADGWLATGDVASIDPHGYVTILDRLSDLIHAGGTWISATALETAALAHPDVAEAACIAARHPKWVERPLLLLVAWPGRSLDLAGVQALLQRQLPRWSLPDALLPLPALPRTRTGRVDKLALRRQYADYLGHLPTRA